MKKFALAFAALAVFALAACSSEKKASCQGCDPACEQGKFCNSSFTCVDIKLCTDPVCNTDTEVCNFETGKCEAKPEAPKECSPACTGFSPTAGGGQICDDGECVDAPACDPVCNGTTKFCVVED